MTRETTTANRVESREPALARDGAAGVSVVVCCHNSAGRLRPTIAHLMAQQVPSGVRWEVVLVDNASSDDTAAMALELWKCETSVPLRVVSEYALGLSHARLKGISEAAYDFIAFVDDDNWLAPGWVAAAFEVMEADAGVGACWGVNEGVYEVEPPQWFSGEPYAIGDPGPTTTDAYGKSQPWGAGLVIRRAALKAIWKAGFRFQLSGRKGTGLSSGDDTELCLALQVAGWRWAVDRRLVLRHYMPAARITWEYFCRLAEAQGASSPALDPYNPAFHVDRPFLRWLRRRWSFQVLRTFISFAKKSPGSAIPPWSAPPIGHPDSYWVMATRGRIKRLLTERGAYSARFDAFDAWAGHARGRAARECGGPHSSGDRDRN